MAIDRAPWNALVDDDGSNLVGTVWNKDKIKTVILDPVDAALVVPPPWVNPAFAAGNYTGTGGTWTVTAGNQLALAYRTDGNLITVHFYIQNTTVGAGTYQLNITIPGLPPWRHWNVTPVILLLGAATSVGLVHNSPGTTAIGVIRDLNVTAFPAGTTTVAGTVHLPIA